jgi:hypothetical protein
MPRLTPAQQRLLDAIRAEPDGLAEYWPIVNDWVRDKGAARHLALRNINRTVEALIQAGVVTLDNDGIFHATRVD